MRPWYLGTYNVDKVNQKYHRTKCIYKEKGVLSLGAVKINRMGGCQLKTEKRTENRSKGEYGLCCY